LIELFLSRTLSKGKRWTPTGGTLQGGDQPALANLSSSLGPADETEGYRMVRYADDFVVLCRTAEQRKPRSRSEELGEQNGLRLNVDKTHVGIVGKKGRALSFWAIASRRGGAG
jgi:RNA-directed DNA polymerase